MNLANAIAVGVKEILAHKFRSVLTMLGIILGVSSLVAMSAIVKGMEIGMKEALIAMGGLDKVLTQMQPVPVYQEHLADQAPGRTIQDVRALKTSAPLLRVISPEMALPGAVLTKGGKIVTPSELVGAWAGRSGNEPPLRGARPVFHRSGRGTGAARLRDRHSHPRRAVRLA